MSYQIVKSIKRNKKDNKIFIVSASSNLYPHTFYKDEYMPDKYYSEEDRKNKMIYLFRDIIGMELHLTSSVSDNWKYAENKFNEYCRENDISTFDLWHLPSKNNGDITVLKPYCEIFEKYLYEKEKEGKYFINSNIGIIVKVNSKTLEYNNDMNLVKRYCKNYKKVYNAFCKLSKETIDKYNIRIEEYSLEKSLNTDESNLGFEL